MRAYRRFLIRKLDLKASLLAELANSAIVPGLG